MKRLQNFSLDAKIARDEWREFEALLRDNETLRERDDILPFFKNRNNLSALLAYYFPDLRTPDRIANEFLIHGEFRADLIVGDSTLSKYVLVEFEDATPISIFKRTPKNSPDWSPRFEAAFSQLIDWFWKLEDMRSTQEFSHAFGTREASFHGLIVCGKNLDLGRQEASRLKWRIEKTMVDSKAISVVSFDTLRDDADFRLKQYLGV